jgi:hypothetical protein
MGIFNSKCKDSPKVEKSAKNLLVELGSIIDALYALRELEIEVASDNASNIMLMAASFEDICNARLKAEKEIERIQSETEEQILRYQAKAKAISDM